MLYRQEELKSTAENSKTVVVRIKRMENQENKNYEQIKTLLNLSEILISRIRESRTEVYSDLLHLCGLLLFEFAESSRQKKKALWCWEKELPMRRSIYGENEYTASTYANLAHAYLEFEDFEKAIKYQMEAIRIMEQIFEKDSQDIAHYYNNMGVIYEESKNWEEAIVYLEKTLDICKKNPTISRKRLGDTLCELGWSYYSQGGTLKGIQCIEKGLSELIKAVGEKNKWVATRYSNLSVMYIGSGNSEKATEYAKKAYEIQEELLGENHADTAMAYNAYAVTLSMDSPERIIYEEKAFVILKKILGENHSWTATVCANLALFYWEAGRKEEGLFYGEKAVELQGNLPECKASEFSLGYCNLGRMYSENGDNEKGIAYLEKAKGIKEAEGLSDYALGKIYSTLSFAYWRASQYRKAIPCMKKSWEVRKECTGKDSYDTIWAKEQLDYMEAQEKLYQNAKEKTLNKLMKSFQNMDNSKQK